MQLAFPINLFTTSRRSRRERIDAERILNSTEFPVERDIDVIDIPPPLVSKKLLDTLDDSQEHVTSPSFDLANRSIISACYSAGKKSLMRTKFCSKACTFPNFQHLLRSACDRSIICRKYVENGKLRDTFYYCIYRI